MKPCRGVLIDLINAIDMSEDSDTPQCILDRIYEFSQAQAAPDDQGHV